MHIHPLALELMKSVNGSHMTDDTRFGHMTLEKAADTVSETVLLIKAAVDKIERGGSIDDAELAKSVTLSSGIYGVDLSGPARNLFPTITPMANMLGRNVRANPGNALQFKQILSTTGGGGYNAFGFVPEGGRAARMSYTTVPQAIGYATLGAEDNITDEAQSAANGYEDILSTAAMRVLLKAKQLEEGAIIGGNNSVALGVTPTPVLTATGSGATLPALTYSVICVALTQMGYRHSTLAAGVATATTVTGADGKTFTVNPGSAMKSAAATQAITLGQILTATVAPVSGAVAYAWFVGAAGAEKLEAITNLAAVAFSAPLNGTRQAATAITVDSSSDTKAFDGFLTTTFKNGAAGNAQVTTFANNGSAGTQMTSNGYGGVTEIDAFLKSAWDTYRIGYDVIYVSSQEIKTITKLSLTGTSTSLLKYDVVADNAGRAGFELTASGVVANYTNPYSIDGSSKIPIKIHPDLAPGTMMFVCHQLPAWYISNETPAIAEMIVRKDWNVEDWARITRAKEMGIYAQEALAIYTPFATGLICNLAPTP